MKKTVKINIGGVVFHVDEDALVILNAYIERVKSRFSTDREGSEIIADIENRIAELLQLKLNDLKQAITIDDVNDMMSIMGRPEEFDEETDEEPSYTTSRKRLYRDLDANVIGGVCAGLGAYFNIDPVILRVLFVVLSFPFAGFPIALYIVLWIAIPAAITTIQKMEMRGGNFTISDIEQKVKTEFENVKGNFQKIKDSDRYNRGRNTLNNAGNGIVEIINFVGRVFLVIIGVFLIIIGISLITGFFGVFMFSDSFLPWTHTGQHHVLIPDFLFSFVNPKSILLATISVIIFIAAPIIAIIYWGLKLILRFKAKDKIISLIGIVAWILSIITLFAITMFEVREFAFTTQIDDSIEMNLPANQTLYVKSNIDMEDYTEIFFFDEGLDVFTLEEFPERVYLEPDLDIRYTSNKEISLKFDKKARGATNNLARANASEVEFNWHLQDSILYIDPLFYHKKGERWTFPELKIVLYLPEGQKICVDKSLEQTLDHAQAVDDIWTDQIPGKYWVMTTEGLNYPDKK